jgi:hypothetical protein
MFLIKKVIRKRKKILSLFLKNLLDKTIDLILCVIKLSIMAFIEDHRKLTAILSVLIFILTEVCLFTYQLFVFIKDWRYKKKNTLPILFQDDSEIPFEDVIDFREEINHVEEEMIKKPSHGRSKSKIDTWKDRVLKHIKDLINSGVAGKLHLLFQLSVFIFVVYSLVELKILKKPMHYTGKWSLQNPVFRFFQVIYDLFSGRKDIYNYVPKETDRNVYLGYSGICVLLLSISVYQLKIKRYIWAAIHFLFSSISFATIMMMVFSEKYETRWHHMSYGLLLTITNLNSLTLFGSYFVFDSIGYWFKHSTSYGYDNIIEKYTVFILVSLLACSLFQIISFFIFKKLRQKYKLDKMKRGREINGDEYFAVPMDN